MCVNFIAFVYINKTLNGLLNIFQWIIEKWVKKLSFDFIFNEILLVIYFVNCNIKLAHCDIKLKHEWILNEWIVQREIFYQRFTFQQTQKERKLWTFWSIYIISSLIMLRLRFLCIFFINSIDLFIHCFIWIFVYLFLYSWSKMMRQNRLNTKKERQLENILPRHRIHFILHPQEAVISSRGKYRCANYEKILHDFF